MQESLKHVVGVVNVALMLNTILPSENYKIRKWIKNMVCAEGFVLFHFIHVVTDRCNFQYICTSLGLIPVPVSHSSQWQRPHTLYFLLVIFRHSVFTKKNLLIPVECNDILCLFGRLAVSLWSLLSTCKRTGEERLETPVSNKRWEPWLLFTLCCVCTPKAASPIIVITRFMNLSSCCSSAVQRAVGLLSVQTRPESLCFIAS